ncbi:MAG TPA: TRAP transporter substrate-binding protein DctP [Polyangiaceae bacterium]|nr:TRAP transporter substrate-binding protein DctP [Polyangiaceae bacterium]
MTRRLPWFVLFVVFMLSVPSVSRAQTVVKIGTLAPADSLWAHEFKKLAAAVSTDTNGELQLDFQWNGQAGDEVLMVQKIRTGQLDAAAVTALGLAQTGVQDILLFDLPGLFTSWAKLDAARDAMKDDFTKMFEAKGFDILGWGDIGELKTMTVGFEVHHPTDLRGKGVFFLPGDPIQPRVFAAIGGITPRQVSLNEILPGLQSGSLNVLVAPPLAAEQLQWTSRITHISTETLAFGIGAFIASAPRMQSLPPRLREVIERRGRESSDRLNKMVRNLDSQAYARLKASRTAYSPTDADRNEWKDVFIKVANQLRGSVFTPALFDRVVALAGNPLVPKY